MNMYKRTILKFDIDSKFLQNKRTIRIFLPNDYMPWISYPAVYCQDGEEFFNFGRIATLTNQLIFEHDVSPYLIIGVDVDLKHRTDEYSPDGMRYEDYVRFFTEEVIPFVENQWQIHSRILAGDSLGAAVNLGISLRSPHLFPNLLCLSGAFLPCTVELIKHLPDLSWLNAYLLIGTLETQVVTKDKGIIDFLTLNRNMHAELLTRNVSSILVEKTGDHLWGFWQKELPNALLHFFKTF